MSWSDKGEWPRWPPPVRVASRPGGVAVSTGEPLFVAGLFKQRPLNERQWLPPIHHGYEERTNWRCCLVVASVGASHIDRAIVMVINLLP